MTYIPTDRNTFFEQGRSNSMIADLEAGYKYLGDAAKIFSKKFKIKVLAKHLEDVYDTKHHVAANIGGKSCGRYVKLIAPDKIENFTKEAIEKLIEADQKAQEKKVQGFYYEWESGWRGKKHKVLCVWEGFEGKMPKSVEKTFESLDPQSFEIAKTKVGATYHGCKAPSKSEFLPKKDQEKLEKERVKKEAADKKALEKAQKERAKKTEFLKNDKNYKKELLEKSLKTPQSENWQSALSTSARKWVAYSNGEAVAIILMSSHDAHFSYYLNDFEKFRALAKQLLAEYGEVKSL